jgi:hypothetical protein
MITHIVMWTMKDNAEGADKNTNARKMKQLLEALPALIPCLVSLQVSTEVFASSPECDIILNTTFKTRADLDAYQVHPEHQKVVEFVKKVVASRSVVDYEL